jgi:hypothetical protein
MMRRPMAQLLAHIRQLLLPREFRIARSVWPPDIVQTLEKLANHTAPEAPGPALSIDHLKLLAAVGTGVWRMRQRMIDPGTDRPREEMKRAYRHLESTWDVLLEAGITIKDHTGELIPEGGIYGLKRIAQQPTPGLTRARVIETLKPSIYCGDQMIQMGEVIIGIPEDDSSVGDPPSGKSGAGA